MTTDNPLSLFVPKGAIYRDGKDKVQLDARNGIIQANFVLHQAAEWTPESRLTPTLLCKIQELGINQIYRCAGHFRDGPVTLKGDGVHREPPPHTDVPDLAREMCDYICNFWDHPAVHLAAYAMWRINWIHPFFGGNGRTSRSASYLILCAKLGFVLPGRKAIPELIVENRGLYHNALRSADAAWERGELDLSDMEALMSELLASQLLAVHEQATGRPAELE